MAREDGRHIALDRLERVIGVGAGEPEEDGGDAGERQSAPLQGDDGVVEGRLCRVSGDTLHCRLLFRHGRVEGRPVVFRPDSVEGRSAIGRGPGFKQRIAGSGHD